MELKPFPKKYHDSVKEAEKSAENLRKLQEKQERERAKRESATKGAKKR